MKKLKTRSPHSRSKFNFNLIIILILLAGFLVWRVQGAQRPTEGYINFKATLLDQPSVYEKWQYFFINGYSVKVDSKSFFEVGDILEIEGELSDGRLTKPEIKKVGESVWQKNLFSLRSKLKGKIFSALPQPQAGFLAGILLGEREDLTEKFKENLRRSGTIHVVVVSGYNISVVGGFLAGLARFVHRRIATILAILGIIFYTLLVGADPPAIRAAIMGSLAFFAVLSGRQRFSLYSLLLSSFIMIVASPNIISNISFQLSFLATGGIILFHEKIFTFLKFLPKPFNEDLATTLSAQILVVPIIYYHFGSVSAISPLVNGLVLWVIPLSTIAGFVFLAVSFLAWPIAVAVSWVLWALLTIFIFIVEFFGQLSIGYFSFSSGNFLPLVIYYFLLTILLIYLKYERVASSKHK